MANPAPWLLYLGRLEKEKWCWLLIERIRNFEGGNLPFELYIFGSGSLEEEILELGARFSQIHYFGWKPLSEVERYLGNIDYCLMPSICLETFGLSAVNVLNRGLPVIGFQKWGLKPFILDAYALNKCPWSTPLEQLDHMLKKLITEKQSQNSDFFSQISQQCKAIAQKHTPEARFEKFQELVFDFKCRKVVMVSDFVNKIGGIETYMHDVKALLEAHGYEVAIYGSSCPSGFWGKVKKYLGLGLGTFNLGSALGLARFLKKEKPDLIWYHSTLRRHGRLPLMRNHAFPARKRMMYHDLGYFHPFPSQVSEEKQVKKLTLSSFLAAAQNRNPLKLLLTLGKYCSLKLLYLAFDKVIDLHLVPSSFMLPMLRENLSPQGKESKIQTFGHFTQ